MIRFLTAGESHGEALAGILEGLPKGIPIRREYINQELARRQGGYGRGERMKIEQDTVQVISGLRGSITLGSPIAFFIKNKDARISPFQTDALSPITIPRPAHADLAGALKYRETDLRNILERASARETACRVVVGAFCKQFLECFKIRVLSHVTAVGNITVKPFAKTPSVHLFEKALRKSSIGCVDPIAEKKIMQLIDYARDHGDSLGGVIEILAYQVPPGLGSCMHWDRRIDAAIFEALGSIPAVKGVEIGLGFSYAKAFGSKSHDAIYYSQKGGFYHRSNNSGGIEGGMTTGEPLMMRVAMKPIATLYRPLTSVELTTKKEKKAHIERSDTIALSACGVVAEAMLSYVLANFFLQKFSADTLQQIQSAFRASQKPL